MSRIARSNASPASIQLQRLLRGDSVSRAAPSPTCRLQRQHAPVGGVVVDDQHAPALRAAAACRRTRAGPAPAASPTGASMVKRERRAVARPVALGPHRAAHQLGEALADREAQPGAAVLARGRRIGLAERLEQPADGLGGQADAGVAHRERELRRRCLPAPRVTVSTTSPRSVNLTALTSRLSRICRSRVTSPLTAGGTSPSNR